MRAKRILSFSLGHNCVLGLVIEDMCTQKEDYLDLIKEAGGTPARTLVTYQKCVSTCVFVCVLLLAIVIS